MALWPFEQLIEVINGRRALRTTLSGSDMAPGDAVPVQLTGSTSETVVSRQILRQNTGISISVPDGVRGAVFLCRVYGATGSGDPQLTFISDTYLPLSSQSAPRLASSPLSSGGSRIHYWVVGGDLGDAIERNTEVKICQLPPVSRMRIELIIDGAFGPDEGFDVQVTAFWLV